MATERIFEQTAAEEALKSMFGVGSGNATRLADDAKDFAVYKGLLKRDRDLKYEPFQFCLLPSPFPAKCYSFMKEIQPVMNYVIHRVAHSMEFLLSCLESTIQTDEFTARIWKLYKTVEEEGVCQPLSLGLLRCDYMLDDTGENGVARIKQIENNTFAVAFSNMAPLATDIHRFVLDRLGKEKESSKLPSNNVMLGFAKAMVSAWEYYGNEKAVILFIVEDAVISNICDQRGLEFTMWEINSKVKVLRRCFRDLHGSLSLDVGNKSLFVDNKEVAIVYYRWGYVPHHYTDEDWDLRLMIERSRAVKCPSAAYHLAGTKKVQYRLCLPGVLERFLPEGADPLLTRQVFARQYALDMDEKGDEAVAIGIANPHQYVLKPEREGGGNNLYGEEIREMLYKIGRAECRQAYILMEKVNAPLIPNCIVSSTGVPRFTNVTLEVGIYGVLVGTKNEIYQNEETGFVVKTKETHVNEGGLCRGIGALGSLYLI